MAATRATGRAALGSTAWPRRTAPVVRPRTMPNAQAEQAACMLVRVPPIRASIEAAHRTATHPTARRLERHLLREPPGCWAARDWQRAARAAAASTPWVPIVRAPTARMHRLALPTKPGKSILSERTARRRKSNRAMDRMALQVFGEQLTARPRAMRRDALQVSTARLRKPKRARVAATPLVRRTVRVAQTTKWIVGMARNGRAVTACSFDAPRIAPAMLTTSLPIPPRLPCPRCGRVEWTVPMASQAPLTDRHRSVSQLPPRMTKARRSGERRRLRQMRRW